MIKERKNSNMKGSIQFIGQVALYFKQDIEVITKIIIWIILPSLFAIASIAVSFSPLAWWMLILIPGLIFGVKHRNRNNEFYDDRKNPNFLKIEYLYKVGDNENEKN